MADHMAGHMAGRSASHMAGQTTTSVYILGLEQCLRSGLGEMTPPKTVFLPPPKTVLLLREVDALAFGNGTSTSLEVGPMEK